jgi:hypothetical protein
MLHDAATVARRLASELRLTARPFTRDDSASAYKLHRKIARENRETQGHGLLTLR